MPTETTVAPTTTETTSTTTTPTAPVPESVTSSTEPSPSEGFDFDSFNKGFDSDESEPPAPSTTPAPVGKTEVAPQPPAPQAKEPPKGPEAAPQTPEPGKTPAPAAAEPKTPTPVPEAPKQPTAEERQAQYTQWRSNAEAALVKQYAIPPADVEKLLTEPDKVLPQMAARVFLDVAEYMQQNLPAQVAQIAQAVFMSQAAVQKDQEAFFNRWPQLRGKDADIMKFAKAFREANPQMSREDFIEQVGAAVSVALKLPTAPGVATTNTPTRPSPQGEVISREVISPSGAGFQPAPTGGTAPPPVPKAPGNIWEEMSQDVLDD